MKKIVATIVALIVCWIIFAGCGSKTNGDVPQARFVIIDNSVSVESPPNGTAIDNAYFFADRETGVVYFYIDGFYRGAITVLLNADGTPMLYDFEHKKIIEGGDK